METVTSIIIPIIIAIFVILAGIGIFFFFTTRAPLLFRSWFRLPVSPTSHIYPVYSEKWLIKIVDSQFVISAILLFQYKKLVNKVITELSKIPLSGKKILITSCAFGNVIPRIVQHAQSRDIGGIVITDIVPNELTHMKEKLGNLGDKIKFSEEDAAHMKQQNESCDINIIFFLFHELPRDLKEKALAEAGRVLVPGGKLILGEFHRPTSLLLRAMSKTYFSIFEPYATELWGSHDLAQSLEKTGAWKCEKTTYLFGNFQIVVATKIA